MKMLQKWLGIRAVLLGAVVLLLALSVVQAQVRVTPESNSVTPATKPVVASAVAGAAQPSGTPAAAQPTDETLIGGGDLVEVSVYGAPDFSKVESRINSQGEISLPMLGPVHIAGMGTTDAEKLVASKLAEGKFFNDPRVSIFVKEYATQGVSVLGEVLKPGVYPVLGSRQLFDAISLAGGLTPKAGSVVAVTHRGDSTSVQVAISNDPEKSAGSNVKVFPGDTIFVPRAGIVYVVGDVKTPGGFVLDNSSRMTVLKAIAMAQGVNPTASLNNAKLVRKTPSGQEEQPLELKKILSGKSPDVAMLPDDIVFIPSSAAKSATRRGLEAILQTATGVAIYRP
jgi:polysaccharide export outer membrane protein